MWLITRLKSILLIRHIANLRSREFLKYIGPGLLVTVGFIDPGNWAANLAAGSGFGYKLLWVVTLSTFMLIVLQHNAAHLGIATGDCLSESIRRHLNPVLSFIILLSAIAAVVATAMAEILGAAIALNMLFHIPLVVGSIMTAITVSFVLFSNTYKRVEVWIIGFVSLIGFSFVYELLLADVNWPQAISGIVMPEFPAGSMPIIMSVLGAVVMPHNLFLHSEIIQSRQWNLEDKDIIKKQLDHEFMDTFFSMVVGWVINCAIIILAASVFFANGIKVTELPQAGEILRPFLGDSASVVFAVALLFAGFASSVTAGMAGASIMSGMFGESYDIKDRHSQAGLLVTYGFALLAILFVLDPFKGLVWSQIILSIQLPITVFVLIHLTSSKKVMGEYANPPLLRSILLSIAAVIFVLNILLLKAMLIA